MTKLIAAVLFAVTIVPSALAQSAGFTAIDTNADGQLSMDEVAAFYPDATQDAFAKADVDGSGSLSTDEFDASPFAQ